MNFFQHKYLKQLLDFSDQQNETFYTSIPLLTISADVQASKTLGISLGNPSLMPIFETMCSVVSFLPAVILCTVSISNKTGYNNMVDISVFLMSKLWQFLGKY